MDKCLNLQNNFLFDQIRIQYCQSNCMIFSSLKVMLPVIFLEWGHVYIDPSTQAALPSVLCLLVAGWGALMKMSWVWPFSNHLLLSLGSSQQPLLLSPVLRHTHTHKHKPTSLPEFQASTVFVVPFSWPQWLVQGCDGSRPSFLVRLPVPGYLKKAHRTQLLESYSLTHHHKPLRCQEKAPIRTKYSCAPKRPSKLVSTCFYHQTSKASKSSLITQSL